MNPNSNIEEEEGGLKPSGMRKKVDTTLYQKSPKDKERLKALKKLHKQGLK